MDKKKIEEFATTARKQLIQNLTYEASRIGITPTEIQKPTTEAEDIQTFTIGTITNTLYKNQIEQRNQLIEEIETHSFDEVIEKIAYTWFNRIIAIRFMEINNYLPTHTRVLSSITPGKKEPDIITEALNLDLDYTEEEIQEIYKYKTENQTDELFKLLFIKQCNKLNEILPELFETIDDYTEILFNIQLSNENNIINKLITTIPEEDFTNQVEIIGWMYQYYNSEKKDKANKSKEKINKETLPYVTQLFTPDWIVKYMVQNSLGRLYKKNNENTKLHSEWKYYIEETQQIQEVTQQLEDINFKIKNLTLEEIKIIDPSMGSGHILVYVFDLLIKMYLEKGYTQNDATIQILEKNIYGLDIDNRAFQLAYFALMMKARENNKTIFQYHIKPNLFAIEESNSINENDIKKIFDENIYNDLTSLIKSFIDAKEYGTILKIPEINIELIENNINKVKKFENINYSIYSKQIRLIEQLIKQYRILKRKYEIVVTNPPYLGYGKFDNKLTKYTKKHYPLTKADLFAVFIEKCIELTKENMYTALVTMQSWMFLSTYEKFRDELFDRVHLINMAHLGKFAFPELKGEVVQTTSFILQNKNLKKYFSVYNNLTNYYSSEEKDKCFMLNNFNITSFEKLSKIPHKTIAYWVENSIIESFKETNFDEISLVKKGIVSGDNNRFIKFSWEIDKNKLFNKWIPCAKGGNYRKYYGNIDRVIDWSEETQVFYNNNNSSSIVSEDALFKKGITFSSISSKGTGFRYLPETHLFSNGGNSIVNIDENIYLYCLAFLNSKIAFNYLNIMNPTLNINLYNIKDLPILINYKLKNKIEQLTELNLNFAKEDWDSKEISLDFKKHPLLNYGNKLKKSFDSYHRHTKDIFESTKENEEKINQLFNEVYHISSITPEIENKDVTIYIANEEKDVKSLLSYILGCIFGRYSLDENGLIFAGGEFDINRYKSIQPDEDNIIPILEEEYFNDDIVYQIINFLKIAFGEDTLEENLEFIAESLNVSGKSSQEVIRNYMIKKFYSNHTTMYQNCPIYWMFDSGKENAFKCLVYMHRYEPDLVSRIRFDYLHKTQKAIEDNIKLQESIINDSENKSRVNKANKKKTKLIKQLDEIKVYDLALAHVANQRIEIDLDDGVKVNYSKFQNIEIVDPNTNNTRKINLLKKI